MRIEVCGTIEAAFSTKVLPVVMQNGSIQPIGIIAGSCTGRCRRRRRAAAERHGVVTGGDVHAGIAPHQVVRRTRALDDFDAFSTSPFGFGQHLAHFGGEQRGEFVEVLSSKALKRNISWMRWGSAYPTRPGSGGGGLDGGVDLLCVQHGASGDLFAEAEGSSPACSPLTIRATVVDAVLQTLDVGHFHYP